MPPFLWGRSEPCSVSIFCHSWVLREHSGPTQSTQGAFSNVHPKLLTPLYSVQIARFSAIFTSPKYPCSIPEHIMNDTSQFWWALNLPELQTAWNKCNRWTGHPDFDEAINMCLSLPFWMLCGPWDHGCSGLYQPFPHPPLLQLPSLIPLLSLHYSLTMGKGSFQCDEDAQKKQCECCLESGYILRVHEEEDTKQRRHHHDNKTKELHCQHVVLFTEWVFPPTTYKAGMFHSCCVRYRREVSATWLWTYASFICLSSSSVFTPFS